jgi:predicted lactoylglutathione lyase
MSTKIFVNLPVTDLATSTDFYTALGYGLDPRFSDENASCIVLSDDIYVMLLVKGFFQNFTTKQICDASTQTEAIFALSAESREAVDALVDKALASGGKPANDRTDQGGMYGWSFQDPDGHLWEVLYMDPSTLARQ